MPKLKIRNYNYFFISIAATLFLSLVVLSMNAQSTQEVIKDKIEKGKVSGAIIVDGIKLYDQDSMAVYYRDTDYVPIWTNINNQRDMVMILEKSYDEGLNPDDYHLRKIKEMIKHIESGVDNSMMQANLDLLLSDAMAVYARNLIWGKVDQSEIRKDWDLPELPKPPDVDKTFEASIENQTLPELFSELAPNHFMYVYLKKGLKSYREIEAAGGWPRIPEGETLKKGMSDTRIKTIREYLTITGDLIISEDQSSLEFDDTLEDAIKSFQFRHNLTQDGAIGKNTLAQMNVTVSERIDILRVNMERARWIMHELEPDFLVVNIAGYNVRRLTNESTVYYSPVIVGRTYHESPVFKAKLSYIEINPTWTLPYSIATKETLPKLKKDPGYLAQKNMVIMDSKGNILDPKTIDFSKYSRGNFPFIIRQEPGPKNALGEVKFMFPNKYSVYLHDTPGRSLFSREERAFSHGCIRLQKKWELLINLMDDPEVWNMDKINSILATEKTTRINLPKPIDILILYWTAGADKEGRLYFNRDIYKRDKLVLDELNSPMDN